MSEYKPPKAAFFCPNCVSDILTLLPTHCPECDNQKIIAANAHIATVSENYCIPQILFTAIINNGLYHIVLLTCAEAQGGLSAPTLDSYKCIINARFIKDRFFFMEPLDTEFLRFGESFLTHIAWIPKHE